MNLLKLFISSPKEKKNPSLSQSFKASKLTTSKNSLKHCLFPSKNDNNNNKNNGNVNSIPSLSVNSDQSYSHCSVDSSQSQRSLDKFHHSYPHPQQKTKHIKHLFEKYKNNETQIFDFESTCSFFTDCTINIDNVIVLVFAYFCDCSSQGNFTYEEFKKGMQYIKASKIEDVKPQLTSAWKNLQQQSINDGNVYNNSNSHGNGNNNVNGNGFNNSNIYNNSMDNSQQLHYNRYNYNNNNNNNNNYNSIYNSNNNNICNTYNYNNNFNHHAHQQSFYKPQNSSNNNNNNNNNDSANANFSILMSSSCSGMIAEDSNAKQNETSFRDFYKFCFAFSKEPGGRSLDPLFALELWKLLLLNHFASLHFDQWCEYINNNSERLFDISYDTWISFYDFLLEYENVSLKNFDLYCAWPEMIDDFVLDVLDQKSNEN